MRLLTPAQLQRFRDVMKSAHDTFHQKPIVWKRLKSPLDRWGEDNDDNDYDSITLRVNLNYNYMRTWPTVFNSETGDIDRQSIQILINKDYLQENNWLNSDGYFIYDPGNDYFLIDGVKYIPSGDTPVSQMDDYDVLFSILVKKDEKNTGDA